MRSAIKATNAAAVIPFITTFPSCCILHFRWELGDSFMWFNKDQSSQKSQLFPCSGSQGQAEVALNVSI